MLFRHVACTHLTLVGQTGACHATHANQIKGKITIMPMHLQISREQMIKPLHSQAVEGLPFNGNSTYAKEFGVKEVAYTRVRPSNAYEPNAVSMRILAARVQAWNQVVMTVCLVAAG